MKDTIKKLVNLYKSDGLFSTAKIAYKKVHSRAVKSLSKQDNSTIFAKIYEGNLWKSNESRSGAGSELANTANLIKLLPEVFERFKIQTIIDAPCGDFNWMKHVPMKSNLSYLGIDIVPDLIKSNQKNYGNEQYNFILADITKGPLPRADLLFCRDCLFHLPYKDIFLVLKNFVESDIPLLLTTTHINTNNFINTNIRVGSFRNIDLFAEPFCLPKDVHYRIEDFVMPDQPREMCLWDKEQIRSALHKMSKMI
jgi:hypothetical protein